MHQGSNKPSRTLIITALGVLLTGLYATGECQELPATATGPKLIRCTPAVITSGMSIKLDGYRIGNYGARHVKMRFVQGDNTYSGSPTGGHYNDFEPSLEHVSTVVPEGLTPGKCQIIIDADGLATAPLTVEIAASVSPAPLSGHQQPPGSLSQVEFWLRIVHS